MEDIKLVLEVYVNSPLIMLIGLMTGVSTIMCLIIIAYYLLKRDKTYIKTLLNDDSLFFKYFKIVCAINLTIILMTYIEGII